MSPCFIYIQHSYWGGSSEMWWYRSKIYMYSKWFFNLSWFENTSKEKRLLRSESLNSGTTIQNRYVRLLPKAAAAQQEASSVSILSQFIMETTFSELVININLSNFQEKLQNLHMWPAVMKHEHETVLILYWLSNHLYKNGWGGGGRERKILAVRFIDRKQSCVTRA